MPQLVLVITVDVCLIVSYSHPRDWSQVLFLGTSSNQRANTMTTNNNAIERLYRYLYVDEIPLAPPKPKTAQVIEPKQAPTPLQKPVDEPSQNQNDSNQNKSNKLVVLLWVTVLTVMSILIVNALRVNQNGIIEFVYNETPLESILPSQVLKDKIALMEASASFLPIQDLINKITSKEASVVSKTLSLSDLMTRGKNVYNANCASCHQLNGKGISGVFPAIAGSRIALGDVNKSIELVMNGKRGTAMMAYSPQLNDIDLAAVVTYQRNVMGNKTDDTVQPWDIKVARHTLIESIDVKNEISSGTFLLNPRNLFHAKLIQQRLADHGFYKSRVDGIWGKGSSKSLTAYKKSQGIHTTIIWDLTIQHRLFGAPDSNKSH